MDIANPSEAASTRSQQMDNLRPGDVLDLWSEGHRVVVTVFVARELVGDRQYAWQWVFLDDDTLLEVSPMGWFRYRAAEVISRGTGRYQELVAQDGALVRFEERVRTGRARRRPVFVRVGDRSFRITSTGTAAVERFGPTPHVAPWASFDAEARENVYFGLVDILDESQLGLGLWTTDVAVSIGQRLPVTDLISVLPARPRDAMD